MVGGAVRRVVGAVVSVLVAVGPSTLLAAQPAAAVEPVVVSSDTFERTVPQGWGEAELGGAWQLSRSEGASVAEGKGSVQVQPDEAFTATVGDAITGPGEVRATFAVQELPTGGDLRIGTTLRRAGDDSYFARVRVEPSGKASLAIAGQSGAGGAWLLTGEQEIGVLTPGASFTVVGATIGDNATAAAKAWLAGTAEPAAWMASAIDQLLPPSGEAGLRVASASDAAGIVTVDDYRVLAYQGNIAPVAEFTSSVAGLQLSVDAAPSEDPDGTITSYNWDYGDGTSATKKKPPAKVYAGSGTYNVTLRVTDDRGATASSSRSITVVKDNDPPSAAFSATSDALAVTVDASASVDPDGTIASYEWDFGDGAKATTVQPPAHLYSAPGTYPVQLTVTDNLGTQATLVQDVTVTANVAPFAKFIYTVRGAQVYVDGSTSEDPDGQVAAYSWDYGDGATATGPIPPVHTYAAGGTYNVVLTVTDNRGQSAQINRSLDISLPGAVAQAPGARLPLVYDLASLPGRQRFVAPNGSDESGDGSPAKPLRTLKKAVAVSAAGDSVVLRGGTYNLSDNAATIGKPNLTVIAYPGEIPVFDGSAAAPTATTADGAHAHAGAHRRGTDADPVADRAIRSLRQPDGAGQGSGLAVRERRRRVLQRRQAVRLPPG